MRSWTTGLLGVALALFARDAEATYSISAVDQDTMLVGGAGVSCVGALQVSVIQGLVPGVGVVHAQALLNEDGRDEAVSLMSMGFSAADIIAAVANMSFDFFYEQRQYAAVRLPDDAAAFTGSENGFYAGHQFGSVESQSYSVQGNILTSDNVLTNAAAGYESADACDMAERLMLALEGGALNGEGDSRCTDDGIPADSGFLRIVDASGQDLIFIEVTNTAPESPVELLRAEFELWRETHPCPEDPGETSGGESGSTESGETTSSESGDTMASGTGAETQGSEGDTGSPTTDTNSTGAEGGASTLSAGESDPGAGDDDSSGGCACAADSPSPLGHAGTAGLFVLAWLRRRR